MKEHEFQMGEVYHCAQYEIEGDGALVISNCVKDNLVDNCDPVPVTREIIAKVAEDLKEQIQEAREAYDYDLNMARRSGSRAVHTFLNE